MLHRNKAMLNAVLCCSFEMLQLSASLARTAEVVVGLPSGWGATIRDLDSLLFAIFFVFCFNHCMPLIEVSF